MCDLPFADALPRPKQLALVAETAPENLHTTTPPHLHIGDDGSISNSTKKLNEFILSGGHGLGKGPLHGASMEKLTCPCFLWPFGKKRKKVEMLKVGLVDW